MKNFKQLKVWREARIITKEVYLIDEFLPEKEKFGLSNQIRKSAISISSNIAEGCGRGTKKEFKYFVSVALGSAYELESQIYVCIDLGFISEEQGNSLIEKLTLLEKRLYCLRRSLE